MALIEKTYRGTVVQVAAALVAAVLTLWLGAFLCRPEAAGRVTWPLALVFGLLGWRRWGLAVDLAIVNLPLWILAPMRMGVTNFSLVEVALIAAAIGGAVRVAQTGRFHWFATPLTPYMILMAIVVLLSLGLYFVEWFQVLDTVFARVLAQEIVNVHQSHSASKFFPLRAALTMIGGFVFFHAVVARVRDMRDVRHAVQLSLLSALLVSAFGVGQYFTNWNRVDFEPWGHRVNSTFPDVNSLASFLVANLFMLLPLLTRKRGWMPTGVAWWVLPFLVVSFYMAHSRAAFGAVVLTVPVYLLLRSEKARLEKPIVEIHRRRRFLAMVYVLLLAVLGFVALGLDWLHHTDLEWTRSTGAVAETLKGRLNIWRGGFYNLAMSPWLGRGIGTFYSFLAWQYESIGDPALWNWNPFQENAHNQLIQVFVEMGVIGGGLFVLIVGGVLYQGMRAILIHRSENRTILVGVFCGVAAFILTWVTGHPLVLVDVNLWFWFVCALLFVAGETESVEFARTQEKRRGFTRFVLAALLVAGASRLPTALDDRPPTFCSYGFHQPEFADSEGRYPFFWLEKYAVCRLYQVRPDLVFCLRNQLGEKRLITVTVRVNGREIDQVKLADDSWQVCSYRLPETTRTAIKLELMSDHEWTAPGDRRRLSVQIQSFWENSRYID